MKQGEQVYETDELDPQGGTNAGLSRGGLGSCRAVGPGSLKYPASVEAGFLNSGISKEAGVLSKETPKQDLLSMKPRHTAAECQCELSSLLRMVGPGHERGVPYQR